MARRGGRTNKYRLGGGYGQFWLAASALFSLMLASVVLLIWVPLRWIKRKGQNHLLALPLLSISALIAMVVSLEIATGTLQLPLFTLGTVLFLVFGWAFLGLSLGSMFCSVRAIYRKQAVSVWVKYYSLSVSLAGSTMAIYLLYWNVIGYWWWN